MNKHEPKSDICRYAFGYSDKFPWLSLMLIGFMIGACLAFLSMEPEARNPREIQSDTVSSTDA